jgi:diadenosine tetraphosphate (Ap4A) HIT family hydrolase
MFELDSRLQQDCFRLGRLDLCHLLLLDNAAVPWFILVPETSVSEICDLASAQQLTLLQEMNVVANFVRQTFVIDKLNVAAIGNIVRQLHVHVVGRRATDYCWPGVVWGTVPPERYTEEQLAQIRLDVARNLKGFSI